MKQDKNQGIINILNTTLNKQKLHIKVVRTSGKYKYGIVDNYSKTQELVLLSSKELDVISEYIHAIKDIKHLEKTLIENETNKIFDNKN